MIGQDSSLAWWGHLSSGDNEHATGHGPAKARRSLPNGITTGSNPHHSTQRTQNELQPRRGAKNLSLKKRSWRQSALHHQGARERKHLTKRFREQELDYFKSPIAYSRVCLFVSGTSHQERNQRGDFKTRRENGSENRLSIQQSTRLIKRVSREKAKLAIAPYAGRGERERNRKRKKGTGSIAPHNWPLGFRKNPIGPDALGVHNGTCGMQVT
jgi:hypothetical protein